MSELWQGTATKAMNKTHNRRVKFLQALRQKPKRKGS
jgi:hypothetical protein